MDKKRYSFQKDINLIRLPLGDMVAFKGTYFDNSYFRSFLSEYHLVLIYDKSVYRKISNIRGTKTSNLNDSHLILQLPLPNPLRPGVKSRNEDVVGAAPTGDAPTTSEWSTN